VTIARFRARHQQALAGLLVASLKLCAAAGMVQVGTVALDGTKLASNASDERPDTLLADSGYWSIANLTQIPDAPELLIPPARHAHQGKPRKGGMPSESKSDPLRAAMTAKLNSEDGKARYAKRRETVEPVFGQIKDVRGARRLLRRGLAACDTEWKLLCGTHNLLKLWRHTGRQPAPMLTTA
jgi:hypothetical protein